MKNINITPDLCRFYINNDKRTVTCVLRVDKYMLHSFMDTIPEFEALGDRYYSELVIPEVYVGVARCAPEDEWNEEYGRKLAYYKMKNKFYATLFKYMNNFFLTFDKNLNALEARINGIGQKWARNLNNLEKILEVRTT